MNRSRVTFGVSLGSFGAGLVPGSTVLAWADLAERLGYETLWFRDHLAWHSPVLDPFTTLGAIAGRTSRIRLGPGVLLLPLGAAAIIAKAMATLDVLSSGRAVLGVGVGGEFPKEFEAVGVPRAERGRRTDEALEAIRTLWTASPSSPASYKGAFVRFESVVMEPRPVQTPHPPIWVGGRSDAALRRAARFGDAWLAYFVTPRRFTESLEKIAAERAEHGRNAFGAGLILYVCVAASREQARAAALQYLSTEYRQPFDSLVDRFCALGSPADCVEAIQRFAEAGADHVAVIPTVPPARVPEQLARIAEEIVPAFHGAHA
jgi:probable F420-dependent oxidoreductase